MIKWPTHYFVLDFETSSLSPSDGDVTEIGLMEVKDNIILHTYEELFNIGVPLSEKIINITGITDDMLKGKRPVLDGMKPYIETVNKTTIPVIGHNLVRFDRLFYDKYCDLLKISRLKFERCIDTASLFKELRRCHVLGHANYDLPNKIEHMASWTDNQLASRTYQNDKVLFNLSAAVAYLAVSRQNIPALHQHRALYDCHLTNDVFQKLVTEFSK